MEGVGQKTVGLDEDHHEQFRKIVQQWKTSQEATLAAAVDDNEGAGAGRSPPKSVVDRELTEGQKMRMSQIAAVSSFYQSITDVFFLEQQMRQTGADQTAHDLRNFLSGARDGAPTQRSMDWIRQRVCTHGVDSLPPLEDEVVLDPDTGMAAQVSEQEIFVNDHDDARRTYGHGDVLVLTRFGRGESQAPVMMVTVHGPVGSGRHNQIVVPLQHERVTKVPCPPLQHADVEHAVEVNEAVQTARGASAQTRLGALIDLFWDSFDGPSEPVRHDDVRWRNCHFNLQQDPVQAAYDHVTGDVVLRTRLRNSCSSPENELNCDCYEEKQVPLSRAFALDLTWDDDQWHSRCEALGDALLPDGEARLLSRHIKNLCIACTYLANEDVEALTSMHGRTLRPSDLAVMTEDNASNTHLAERIRQTRLARHPALEGTQFTVFARHVRKAVESVGAGTDEPAGTATDAATLRQSPLSPREKRML